jgi:hypothetical protein
MPQLDSKVEAKVEAKALASMPTKPPVLTREKGVYDKKTSRRPFVSRFPDLVQDVYIRNLQMPPSGGI